MTILVVPTYMVELLWDKIAPCVQLAVDKAPDECTLEAEHKRALVGDSIILVYEHGGEIISACVLVVRVYDTGMRALLMTMCGGGDMSLWKDAGMKLVHEVAKQTNCTQVRALAARDGWKRIFPNWKVSGYTLKTNVGEM